MDIMFTFRDVYWSHTIRRNHTDNKYEGIFIVVVSSMRKNQLWLCISIMFLLIFLSGSQLILFLLIIVQSLTYRQQK